MKWKSLLLGLIWVVGCSDDATTPPCDEPLSVMTWNLYLGADLTPVLTAPTPADIPGRAAEVWARIQATDFPSRAVQIASEIVAHQPHVVGLQEVSLYRIQSPGDAAVGGTTPATDVVVDHLQLLLQALDDVGARYEVAASVSNFDVEVPMLAGTQIDDIRLTDRDVILVRQGIAFSEVSGQNFQTNAQLGIAGGPVFPFLRGWTSIVLDWFGQPIRLVNTHLESQNFPAVQGAQAQEILDALSQETRPSLLMGDMNSDASGNQTPTYDDMVASGCRDLWDLSRDGNTCCQDSDLLNPDIDLTQRIDFLFAHGDPAPQVLSIGRVGLQRVTLWPSDHVGIRATLRYE